jgi:hypothetical protein
MHAMAKVAWERASCEFIGCDIVFLFNIVTIASLFKSWSQQPW